MNRAITYLENQKKGDTDYFDGNEWRRLPAGTAGQALVVGASGIPEWVTLDASYVANRTRRVDLRAQDFTIRAGTPALGIIAGATAQSRYIAWAFDSGTIESVIAHFLMPADLAAVDAITLRIHHVNLGGGSGNVVLQASMRNSADGANLDTVGFTSGGETITAGAQDVHEVEEITITFSPNASPELVTLVLQRTANDAADNLGNDWGINHVEILYGADS